MFHGSMRIPHPLVAAIASALVFAGAALILADRTHHVTCTPVSATFSQIDSQSPPSLNLTAISSTGDRIPFKRSARGDYFLFPFPVKGIEIDGRKSLLEESSRLQLYQSATPRSKPDLIIEWSPDEVRSDPARSRFFVSKQLPNIGSILGSRPWSHRSDTRLLLFFLCLATLTAIPTYSLLQSTPDRSNLCPSPSGGTTRQLIFATSFAILSVGVLFIFFHPKFGGPDEVHQMALLRGRWSIPPSSHLIFSHLFLGYILQYLYGVYGSLPWYGIHLTLALTAVAGAFLWIIGIRAKKTWVAVALLLAVLTPLWTNVQFTSTAGALCCSGYLLLWLAAHDGKFRFLSPLVTIGGVLVLWGSLIRWESFVHLSLVFLPLVLLEIRPVSLKPRLTIQFRSLVPLLAILAVGAGLAGTNKAAYLWDADWKNFHDLQPSRIQINDHRTFWETASPDDVEQALSEANWTRNDLNLFDNWFYLDPKFLDADSVALIAGVARAPSLQQKFAPSQIWDGCRDLFSSLLQFKLGIAFLILLLLASPPGRQAIPSILTLLTSIAIVHVVIVALAKPPPFRVFFPPLLGAFTLITFHCLRSNALGNRLSRTGAVRWIASVPICLVAALLTYGITVKLGEGQRRHSDSSLFRSECSWIDQQPGAIVYIWADAFRFDLARFPLGELDLPENTPLVLGSYVMTTPPGRTQLKKLEWEPPEISLYSNPETIVYVGHPNEHSKTPVLPREASQYLRLLDERGVEDDVQFVTLHSGAHWVTGQFEPSGDGEKGSDNSNRVSQNRWSSEIVSNPFHKANWPNGIRK